MLVRSKLGSKTKYGTFVFLALSNYQVFFVADMQYSSPHLPSLPPVQRIHPHSDELLGKSRVPQVIQANMHAVLSSKKKIDSFPIRIHGFVLRAEQVVLVQIILTITS
jgi:hypothetical protein